MSSLIDALQTLGHTRVQATLLAHLLEKGASDTKSIIEATGLRQPEVSVGIRALSDQWLHVEPIPREGKGRPMHKYSVKDKAELVSHLKGAAKDHIQRLERAVATISA